MLRGVPIPVEVEPVQTLGSISQRIGLINAAKGCQFLTGKVTVLGRFDFATQIGPTQVAKKFTNQIQNLPNIYTKYIPNLQTKFVTQIGPTRVARHLAKNAVAEE